MLAIYANADCVVTVNDATLGQAGATRFVCAPLVCDGAYYIIAHPLCTGEYAAYLPRAAKLVIADGEPVNIVGATATVWGKSAVAIDICLPRADVPQRRAPLCEVDRLSPKINGKALELTLLRDANMYLVSEGETRLRTTFLLGNGVSGMLGLESIGGAEFISAVVKYADCERLILFDDEMNGVLDITGDSAGVAAKKPFAVKRHDTLLLHEERVEYDYADGAFHAGSARLSPGRDAGCVNSEARVARAFFDAVRLGLAGEAMGYLSAELRAMLDFPGVRRYLGDFTSARMPVTDESGRVMGLVSRRKDADGISDAVLTELEFEGMLICNIAKNG